VITNAKQFFTITVWQGLNDEQAVSQGFPRYAIYCKEIATWF
jgi:hypothetical protein